MKTPLKKYIFLICATALCIALLTLLNYTGHTTKSAEFRVIVPEDFRVIQPGSTLEATLIIFNVEVNEKIPLIYSIKKIGSEELTSKREIITIDQETTFPLTFTLPKNAEPGIYQLRIAREDNGASTAELFEVRKNQREFWKKMLTIFISILILAILLTLIILIKKHWEWLRNLRLNMMQLFMNLKWSARRKNYFLSQFYIAIAILVLIIIAIIFLIK